jgi:hypothetical protein
MSLKATMGAMGPKISSWYARAPAWHVGEYRRSVEELVVAAPGQDSSTSGDAVAHYCVNSVSCGHVNQRSVRNIIVLRGVSDAKVLRPFGE